MKRILSAGFALLLAVALMQLGQVASASEIDLQTEDVKMDTKFTDVTDKYWAKNEIMQLVELGIMTGERDMQFRPNGTMTVGEAAIILADAFNLKPVDYKPIFNDVQKGSEYEAAVMATYEAKFLHGKLDGSFGVNDFLSREQLANAMVQAFKLYTNGDIIGQFDWSIMGLSSTGESGVLPQSGLEVLAQPESSNPYIAVDRATFAVNLHHALIEIGIIKTAKQYHLTNLEVSDNFIPSASTVSLEKVSFDENPIYLRSEESIQFTGHTRIDNSFSRDNVYEYDVGDQGATIELTVRSFDNGDYFLFSKINNPSSSSVAVDVIQKENDVETYELHRYDRYNIKRNSQDVFGSDTTSYPTGVLRFVKKDGTIKERMVGQSYQSKQLSMTYPNEGYSFMRELLSEKEALSFAQVGTTLISIYTLSSKGDDIVDQWYMNAEEQLFVTDEHMDDWMQETATYYKKRNNWYTANGPFNKMATTTEPMPETGQGYGRNLLLVKEDRALVLYHQQKDRYFENLVNNSFVNLKNFKGDKTYWETEVTSTYLKDLYGITAPFVDTRFNEQIALFFYNSGAEFDVKNAKEPLRNYADLLVSQKEKGNIIPVDEQSYYLSDYYPIVQDVPTHASMNHVLGGMNILLIAYNEFGDEKYLKTARAIQTAIEKDKNDWVRENGDIWYRISPKRDYKGDDYKHLTLEDLINSYKLWQDIDATYLPLLEEMIASKASYLSNEKLGYTTKIKNGLQDIGLLKHLPEGREQTDAL